MRFSLPKEGVRYQQVIGQREVQNILLLLIPSTIPELPVYPLETYISRTNIAVEVALMVSQHDANGLHDCTLQHLAASLLNLHMLGVQPSKASSPNKVTPTNVRAGLPCSAASGRTSSANHTQQKVRIHTSPTCFNKVLTDY
jgi:hypothetical protein